MRLRLSAAQNTSLDPLASRAAHLIDRDHGNCETSEILDNRCA